MLKTFNTKFYRCWYHLKEKCLDKNYYNYNNYGGRGINVCERWLKFFNFKEDTYQSYLKHCQKYGEKQTTIERINNNGNYEPNNCRWATLKEQANNKRTNHFFSYNEKRLTISQWAEKLNIEKRFLLYRINKGLNIDKMFRKFN